MSSNLKKGNRMPDITPTSEKVLSAFVNKMIEDKGLSDMDRREKLMLRAQLQSELNTQIEKAMLRALSDDELMNLSDLMNGNPTARQVEAVFENSDADYEAAAAQAMKAFRAGFLAEVA